MEQLGIGEAFADCALPAPPKTTPLRGPGSIRNNWADVCGFLKPQARMRFFGLGYTMICLGYKMIFSGYKNLFLTFSEVKGVSSIVELFLTFERSKAARVVVSTVSDPKGAAKPRQTTEKA